MPMTPCPACGAPLEYTGDGETVRCHFCGTEFKVTEEDARPRFEVLGQPGPQKEVLQNGVSQVQDPLAADDRLGAEVPPSNEPPTSFARVYPSPPDSYQQAYQADLNPPPAPGTTTVHSGEASRWSGIETLPQSAPPPQPSGSTSGSDILRRPGTPGRWIAIAVAVILLACMACACVAALIFAQSGGRFQ